MAWDDQHDYQPEIRADLMGLTPLSDFVLVRPLTEAECQDLTKSKLQTEILSTFTMTGDGRYRHNRPRGLQYGRVVACGRGDRLFGVRCVACGALSARLESARCWKCGLCGSELSTISDYPLRAPMDVQPGDIIVISRIPANEIELNGKPYCFAHLEQHVLGIVEGASQ